MPQALTPMAEPRGGGGGDGLASGPPHMRHAPQAWRFYIGILWDCVGISHINYYIRRYMCHIYDAYAYIVLDHIRIWTIWTDMDNLDKYLRLGYR